VRASWTTETSRSTPAEPIAPSPSRSWARRSSALCECAGSGQAPGCASTTSRCTVFEPTSRTPSLTYGTLLPTAVRSRGPGDLPWTGAKDEKGEGREVAQEGQASQGDRDARGSCGRAPCGRREGARLRSRLGGVS